MLILSMIMFPSVTSMIPNKAFINDDLPQPVRPQIPIFSPGEIFNENDLIKNIYMIFIIGISLRLIGLIIMLFKANRDLIFFIKQKVLKMFKWESNSSSILSTKF